MRGGRVIIRDGGAMAGGVRGNEQTGLQAAMEAQLTQAKLRIEDGGLPPLPRRTWGGWGTLVAG
jgi:hypothetical protein